MKCNGQAGLERPLTITVQTHPRTHSSNHSTKDNYYQLKSKVYFLKIRTQKAIFMKGQHRKNANQLGFIFNGDVMKRRLVLMQRGFLPNARTSLGIHIIQLCVESVENITKHSSLEVCKIGTDRACGRMEKTSTARLKKPKPLQVALGKALP